MSVLNIEHLALDLPVQGRRRRVLHDVSLSIGEGEAVGLVGESGAGKSMASRSVIRLLPDRAVTEGSILFRGRSVLAMDRTALREYRTHDVAMIFQDPRAHVNPVRTIGDFLTEALIERGEPRAQARDDVAALLRAVGVSEPERRLRQFPHELSGGLLQRVMIAAALAVTPQLLLADEPTTALDVTTQSDVMVILDDQRRERGLAMLFVTHDLELAAAVCERIVVMYAGFVVEDAPASIVHQRARHPYTAGLLASRPDPTAHTRRLVAIPGRPLSGYEVGAGCAFAPRCAFATERCRIERPALRAMGDGLVACHHAEDLEGHLGAVARGDQA